MGAAVPRSAPVARCGVGRPPPSIHPVCRAAGSAAVAQGEEENSRERCLPGLFHSLVRPGPAASFSGRPGRSPSCSRSRSPPTRAAASWWLPRTSPGRTQSLSLSLSPAVAVATRRLAAPAGHVGGALRGRSAARVTLWPRHRRASWLFRLFGALALSFGLSLSLAPTTSCLPATLSVGWRRLGTRFAAARALFWDRRHGSVTIRTTKVQREENGARESSGQGARDYSAASWSRARLRRPTAALVDLVLCARDS